MRIKKIVALLFYALLMSATYFFVAAFYQGYRLGYGDSFNCRARNNACGGACLRHFLRV